MGSFSMKPKQAEKIIGEEGSLARQLESIERQISSAKNGIQLGAATSQIRSRLGVLASDVSDECRAMNEMRKGLENVNFAYVRTENRLLGKEARKPGVSDDDLASGTVGEWMLPQEAIAGILFFKNADTLYHNLWPVLFPGGASGEVSGGNHLLTDWLQNKIGKYGFEAKDWDSRGKWTKNIDVIDAADKWNPQGENTWKNIANNLKNYNDRHSKTYKKGYWDSNGYHNVDRLDDTDDNKKKYNDISSLEKNMTLASVGTLVSGSVWEKEGGASQDEFSEWGAHGSYEVSALKGRADASAYAGLYSYSEDGTRHFTPGVGAEVGLSVTALSASAKGQLGDEYFNLYGNVQADVGRPGANAGVNVGLFDPNGKLNPQLGVNASAEAIAGELKGTVGTTIAGTAVGVTGGVNFGVGAHANVGLVDGHMSVDIGASLGVGVSVKLDIDMSGTINAIADNTGAIADMASSAWTEFTGWFQ